ncbi:MAG: DUF6883 domain-containing protein [Pseudomonadota bacterium]
MKLPHADRAVVAKSKIVDYLLSLSHPYGRTKAGFFIRHGFSASGWKQFESALKRHATEHEVTESIQTTFGVKYIVEGSLKTPGGANPTIRSVWFVEVGEEIPQLVTAYPL